MKSFVRLQGAELGFEPKGLLSFQTRLPANKYFHQVGLANGRAQLDVSPVPAMIFDRVVEHLQRIPGVQAASGTSAPPILGTIIPAPFAIAGQPAVDPTGANGDLTA